MKRLAATLALGLLVTLLVGTGVASASHGTDYARGTVDQGTNDWRFSASSNFNGSEPSGTIRVTQRNNDPDLVITAKVTCLSVVDGLFEARGVVTNVQGGTTFANSVLIRGSDEGKFSNIPDTFSGSLSPSPDPGPCAAPTPGFSTVQDGEIVVHDS